jgi:hypothetical protein
VSDLHILSNISLRICSNMIGISSLSDVEITIWLRICILLSLCNWSGLISKLHTMVYLISVWILKKKTFDFRPECGYCGYKELYGLLYLLYPHPIKIEGIAGTVESIEV